MLHGLLEQVGDTVSLDFNLAFWVGAMAAAAAILVHGLFDYFLGFTPTNLMIWTTFGLIVAGRELAREV